MSKQKIKRNKYYFYLARIFTKIRRTLIYASNDLIGFPRLNAYCPVCEKKVYRWLPFYRNIGHGYVQFEPEERLCPHCNSFERTRHFALYIRKHGILDSKPRMLHFAPEKGLERKIRAILFDKYITADLFRCDVDRREDITRMKFESNLFDFIYCSNVLEHVQDDTAAMAELFRVLAPGGEAIIQVPIKGNKTYEDASIKDPYERFRQFGQSDHVRLYGEDIQERFSNAGFIVFPFYMLDDLALSDSQIERMNLNKSELVHKCIKPDENSTQCKDNIKL